jgi:hypothetical protein
MLHQHQQQTILHPLPPQKCCISSKQTILLQQTIPHQPAANNAPPATEANNTLHQPLHPQPTMLHEQAHQRDKQQALSKSSRHQTMLHQLAQQQQKKIPYQFSKTTMLHRQQNKMLHQPAIYAPPQKCCISSKQTILLQQTVPHQPAANNAPSAAEANNTLHQPLHPQPTMLHKQAHQRDKQQALSKSSRHQTMLHQPAANNAAPAAVTAANNVVLTAAATEANNAAAAVAAAPHPQPTRLH